MADKAMKEHLKYEDEYDKTANEIANKWLKNEGINYEKRKYFKLYQN